MGLMGQWEPLADRIPVDVRRLATQLRRMKDRSGLTVPALAARTGLSAEAWSLALAGRKLPPLDAVEVLAQVSGADYDRIGALWELARKANAGTGERGRGRPVPYPDPLDPLSPQDGLPGRSRRFLLLAVAALLAAAALAGVLLTAGTGTGGVPSRPDAGPTPDLPGASAPVTPLPGGSPSPAAPAAQPSGPPSGPVASGPVRDPAAGAPTAGAPAGSAPAASDRPSAAPGTGSPSAGPEPGAGHGPAGPGSGSGSGGSPAPGGPPTTAPGDPTTPPPTTPPGTPAPTRSPVCLHVLVLGVCLG